MITSLSRTKATLKQWLRPLWLRAAPMRNALLLVRIYYYDYKRYRRHYATEVARKTGQNELASWILQDKHRIEKGLSFAQVKPNFGKIVLTRLLRNLQTYQQTYDKDSVYFWGVGAFVAYKEFHEQRQLQLDPWFLSLFAALPREDLKGVQALSVGIQKHQARSFNTDEFKTFFESRASVRDFDKHKSVPEELLAAITTVAIKTPSVCNRQHWKLHVVSGDLKTKVLQLQNGNAGFGDDVPQVAIVTSSLKSFSLPAERVQAYTDGGMFAMAILLSAHAHGVSTCPLNWAASLKQDIEIRKLNILDDSEAVIMLIAMGYARDECMIANSPRKDVDDILTLHS